MTTQSSPGPAMQTVYALIAQASEYPDAVFLARGDLDFDAPRTVVNAVVHYLEDERGEFSSLEGLPELRAALSTQLLRDKGIQADAETEITITNGAQEAIFLAVGAVLQAGDEIIYPEPNYGAYRDAITFFGAHKVVVPTKATENFAIDPDSVRAAITPRTRAILLVSPGNPTGSVIDPERAQALMAIAVEHNLMIISDEIYDHCLYDGAVLTSPAAYPQTHPRTLTINSVSKTYALTGIRVGWISGPPALITRIRQLKAAITGPTAAIAQRAALAAIEGPQEEAETIYHTLVRRRKLVMDAMDRLGWTYGVPQGGQFIFVDVSSTGLTGLELTQALIEHAHVVVSPGNSFGSNLDNFIRITFLQPENILADGLERVERTVQMLRQRAVDAAAGAPHGVQ